MGISRRFLLAVALLIAALVAGAAAEEQAAVDPAVPGEIAVGVKEAAEAAALRAELAQLREKISALESGIAERSQDLKTKDDGIAKLEKDIEEKSQKITTLQGEITSLQKKGSVAAEEQAGKAVAQAVELEKQIDILNKEIEAQSSQRTTLEARATKAEKKVQDLNLKLESLQKASGEQKRTIRKTERALKVAEEELMRLQNEATTKAKQLTEVHGAWLPPWLVTYSARYVEVVSGHWNEHGKPALDSFLQKASEKSAHAMKWAEPHIETAKMVLSLDPCILGYLALIILILCLKKLVPVKEKLDVLKKKTKPYLEKVSTKSVEIYEASRDAVTPHIVKLKAVSDPYFQEAKKLSKPYIDQVAELTKPHVEKIRTTLKPYTKRAVHAYGTFLESATTYHRQAQASISDYLHRHEITKSLVTKELVWFLASALLALPVFVIYRLLIDTFCTKKKKRSSHNGNGNNGNRRHKRRHAEK